MLTSIEIEHIAKLARLKLSPEEGDQFARTLSSILDYIGTLNTVDTSNVSPTAYILPLENVTRPDEVRVDDTVRDQMVKNFPDHKDDFLRVPAVFTGKDA